MTTKQLFVWIVVTVLVVVAGIFAFKFVFPLIAASAAATLSEQEPTPTPTTTDDLNGTQSVEEDNSDPTPTPTLAPTPQLDPGPALSFTTTCPVGSDTLVDLTAYLNCPERSNYYQQLTVRAGQLIATDLLAGKFGEFEVSKTTSDADWATISTKTTDGNHNVSVYVWVEADGKTIDFTKGVNYMEIYSETAKGLKSVFLSGPGGSTTYWSGSVKDNGTTWTSQQAIETVNDSGWSGLQERSTATYLMPTSMKEFVVFDGQMLSDFDDIMSALHPGEWGN